MIKVIIFDLDGVLVETKELHFLALNESLNIVLGKEYMLSYQEHLSKYDGLSTAKKLQLLTKERGVPFNLHDVIWRVKQQATKKYISQGIEYKSHVEQTLKELKKLGYTLVCASNSIKSTIENVLHHTGYGKYFDLIISNEDVLYPKPHPEMYLKCMILTHSSPKEVLIVEDSHIGRKAAYESGAHVVGVINSDDLNLSKILDRINSIKYNTIQPKWQGGNMNIIIPMAGAGSRFEKAGYTFPKPLIEVFGKPMIQLVVENLNIDGHYIFIVQKSHYEKYNLQQLLNILTPKCNIIQVDGITDGAACTTLLAKNLIDNDYPLLIANSDQYIEWNSNEFMYSVTHDNIDGGILTFESIHPKWSYVKLNEEGFVCEVAEKNPISNHATCGIYYWKRGNKYVTYAEHMINLNKRVNNEFYICPVYNEAINDGMKIKIFPVSKMYGLGTPEDLQTFINEKLKL